MKHDKAPSCSQWILCFPAMPESFLANFSFGQVTCNLVQTIATLEVPCLFSLQCFPWKRKLIIFSFLQNIPKPHGVGMGFFSKVPTLTFAPRKVRPSSSSWAPKRRVERPRSGTRMLQGPGEWPHQLSHRRPHRLANGLEGKSKGDSPRRTSTPRFCFGPTDSIHLSKMIQRALFLGKRPLRMTVLVTSWHLSQSFGGTSLGCWRRSPMAIRTWDKPIAKELAPEKGMGITRNTWKN